MKNKYEPVNYGEKVELKTKSEAIEYAEGELKTQMKEKLGEYLLREPDVIDGGREGLIYLRLRLSDMYIE